MHEDCLNPLRGGKKAKPTKSHRPAVWEGILGTVYAMNDTGEAAYFDYKYGEARDFSGVNEEDRDLRLWRNPGGTSWTGDPVTNPRKGQLVLWVRNKK